MIQTLCNDLIKGIRVRENLISLNKEIKQEDMFDQFLDMYYERYTGLYLKSKDFIKKISKLSESKN